MVHSQWHQKDSAHIGLQGTLDRDQVPELWSFAETWVPEESQIELSLKEVGRVDSAGMVFLIHLIEHAKKQNCHIMLRFVPEQLVTLFQLSRVDSLLINHIKN
ncbi:STAS domain-containing protein [Vibrio aerogenes]|nr:lipid asymmetry maintenance protein MlaB [Vibrio aerogenes]